MQGHRRQVCFTWGIQWLKFRKDPARDRKGKASLTVEWCKMKILSRTAPQIMKPCLPLGSPLEDNVTVVLKPQGSLTIPSPTRVQTKREDPQSQIPSGEITQVATERVGLGVGTGSAWSKGIAPA